MSQSKEKNWEHDAMEFTDQLPESLIEQCVRARLLDYLPQEIPYLLKCEIEFYTVEKGSNIFKFYKLQHFQVLLVF